jgi:hypothetical protein
MAAEIFSYLALYIGEKGIAMAETFNGHTIAES